MYMKENVYGVHLFYFIFNLFAVHFVLKGAKIVTVIVVLVLLYYIYIVSQYEVIEPASAMIIQELEKCCLK